MYFPHQFFYIVSLHSFADGEVGWVTVHVYDEINKAKQGKVASLLSTDVSNLFVEVASLRHRTVGACSLLHCNGLT